MWITIWCLSIAIVSSIYNIVHHILQVHPGKPTWKPTMEVWFKWFSFSIRGFLGSISTVDHLISGLLHHPSPFKTTWCRSRDDYDSVSRRWSSVLACAWTEASGSQISNSRNNRLPPQKQRKTTVLKSCLFDAVALSLICSVVCYWMSVVSKSPSTTYNCKT